MSKLKGNFKFIDGSVACDLPMNRMAELFNINTFIVSQVNPHVAPFITSDAYSHEKSRLRRRIFTKLRTLVGNEITHWINQLTYLGLFPEYIQGIMDVVIQTYRGHVTISPNPSLYDYKHLLKDVPYENCDEMLHHTYNMTI
jgi:TAG lipase / steryl ester hydrolase / phospholipase A2 / LPA acyltransferase